MKCPKCGTDFEDNAASCKACGYSPESEKTEKVKQPVAWILLAVLSVIVTLAVLAVVIKDVNRTITYPEGRAMNYLQAATVDKDYEAAKSYIYDGFIEMSNATDDDLAAQFAAFNDKVDYSGYRADVVSREDAWELEDDAVNAYIQSLIDYGFEPDFEIDAAQLVKVTLLKGSTGEYYYQMLCLIDGEWYVMPRYSGSGWVFLGSIPGDA